MLKKRSTVELFALTRENKNPWETPPVMRTFAFIGPGDTDLWAMQLAAHALQVMQMLPMSREYTFWPAGKVAAAPVGVYARRGWAGGTRRFSPGPEYDVVIMRIFTQAEEGTLFPDVFYSTLMKARSAACEELYPQLDRITNLGDAIPIDHPCVRTEYCRRDYRWGEVRKDKSGDVVRVLRTGLANAMIRYAFEQLCGPAS